jgi:hypothetical protein
MRYKLLPCSDEQFVQCRNDLPAFLAERSYKITELLDWDGDYLERMQNDRRSPYFERRVERCMT